MYVGLHVKHPLFLSDFNRTWNFSKYFRIYSNIKFHENPSSGSRVFSCGQTDRHDEANSDIPVSIWTYQWPSYTFPCKHGVKMTAWTFKTCSRLPTTLSRIYIHIYIYIYIYIYRINNPSCVLIDFLLINFICLIKNWVRNIKTVPRM